MLIFNAAVTSAQLVLPQASPKATLSQSIGITDIKIEYHKPSVKGRVIWGDVVPYDSVWRTGANEATIISFSTDVKIEGTLLIKGKYALYTIPGKEAWTIIFNKKRDINGPYKYEKVLDAMQVKVKPKANEMTETMLFHISDMTLSSCTINLDWEKLRISIKVEMETDSLFMAYIKDFIKAEPDDASVYKGGAEYTLTSGMHLDLGIQWADMAIKFKPYYENYWLRGNIKAKLGEYQEAIEDYDKGLELAKNNKDIDQIKARYDKKVNEFKIKIGK